MAITQALSSKGNLKKFTNSDIPFNAQQPVINSFYATSTAAQTVINLGFSVDTINGPDAFFLFVDGKKLRLGASNDYTFTSIAVDNTSSQVTLVSSLPINLNVQAYKLGVKAEREFAMDNRFVAAYDYLDQSFQAFVSQSALNTATATVGTPAGGTFYSSISNRAAMVDLSQDLKPRMGIERVMVQQLVQLQNEFGPNGETVWGAMNDTFGQIRFVGAWIVHPSSAYGSYNEINDVVSYVETTFFGTGLNLVGYSGSPYDWRVSVDGGAEGANIFTASTPSGILGARNYAPNQITPVVSGLTAGIHTVKIRANTAAGLPIWGFEILNESSLVKVNPGVSYYKGQKYVSSALQSFAYSAPVTGTRGGRVLTYQTSTGAIGQAFQAVDSTALYLTAASHNNEEMVRAYNFREFGAGRADDFSSNAPSTAAFTLDDGTTTLAGVGSSIGIFRGLDAITINGNSSGFLTITFVGTGLDMFASTDSTTNGVTNTNANAWQISIDGGTAINLPQNLSTNLFNGGTIKLVSGLPYGTHTVKIIRNVPDFFSYRIKSYTVYQPKKPVLPAGSVELADYNVMATYVANTTQGQATLGTGTLRKTYLRELTYSGTWTINSDVGAINLGYSNCSGNADFVEYTFVGTGFDFRFIQTTSSPTASVVAVTNTTTGGPVNLSTATTSVYGGSAPTFTPATGILNQTGTTTFYGAGLSVSNLPLSTYKVRITKGNGTNMFVETLDIITPIHSTKSNLSADLQNTLPVGSQAISDNRKTTPLKDAAVASKAWAQAQGILADATTTSGNPIPCTDMSLTIKTSGGTLEIAYSATCTNSAAVTAIVFQVYVDGSPVGSLKYCVAPGANGGTIIADSLFVPVTAGTHKVDLYWYSGGGTVKVIGTYRTIKAREI